MIKILKVLNKVYKHVKRWYKRFLGIDDKYLIINK